MLIPQANVQHLMLREDVVDGGRRRQVRIYAVATIDQGIEILTGRKAGKAAADGSYPKDSINALVEEKLHGFATRARAFAKPPGDGPTT